MAEGALPEPSAQGNFAKTPFAHLLIYAYERKLSGTMELSAPNEETATIVFVGGQPGKVRTSQPVAYLGRVLLELSMFNEAQLTESLRIANQERRLHGQVLVSTGLITEEQLDRGLRAQLGRKLRYLARLPVQTSFRYYDHVDSLRAYGRDSRVLLDPLPIVWASIRETPPWEHIQVALLRLGGSALCLAKGADLGRFELEAAERATADLLRARPRSVDDVVSAGVVDPRLAQQLLYCLLLAKQIELFRGSIHTAATSTDDAPVDTPRRLPEDPAAVQRFVADEFAKAEGRSIAKLETPFPSPGPAPVSGRPARLVAASEQHTRPTAPSMQAVRPTQATSAPTARPPPEAPGVAPSPPLVATPARVPSIAPMASVPASASAGPDETDGGIVLDRQSQLHMSEAPPMVDPIKQGAYHHEQAQVLMKRGELVEAEKNCKKAVGYDRENAEYLALHGWVAGMLAENSEGRVRTELAIEKLDKALRMNPKLEDAYFHRGVLHKRLGREEEALADFRKAIALNSGNGDAQREIRLIETRKDKKSTEPGVSDLLGRLFRKDKKP